MELKINRVKAFKKWLDTYKRLKIAFGGRGGGKSESILRMLIVKSFERQNTVLLCARETQKSIADSIYSLIISVLTMLNMTVYFDITKTEIINKITNTKFIFRGLRECGIENIKSIHNIWICFIEEGQTITQGSWEILEPSVRAKNSEIWIAFNPRKASDAVYQIINRYKLNEITYINNDRELKYYEYEDEDILITKVNYYSNYYFSDVLEKSRQMCLKLQPQLYGYIWLGELKRQQGKIFSDTVLRFYNYEDYKNNLDIHYTKKAIIDPAFGKENCFTSCVIYSQIGNDFYVLDSGLMRSDSIRTTDEILIEFLKKNNIRQVMCEANFHQKELAKKLSRHFNIQPFYVRHNKIERIINASILIRERILFDDASLNPPEIGSTEDWIKTREGRNFIAMMQLLDFSDINSENCIQGDDFSYIDFPDALASLVLYSKKISNSTAINNVVAFNNNKSSIDYQRQEIDDRIKQIKNKRNIETGGLGFGLNR